MCENRQSGFATETNSSRLQWGTVPHQDPTKSSAVANRNCRVRTPLRAGLQALAAIKSQGKSRCSWPRLRPRRAMEAARGSTETEAAAAVCCLHTMATG